MFRPHQYNERGDPDATPATWTGRDATFRMQRCGTTPPDRLAAM